MSTVLTSRVIKSDPNDASASDGSEVIATAVMAEAVFDDDVVEAEILTAVVAEEIQDTTPASDIRVAVAVASPLKGQTTESAEPPPQQKHSIATKPVAAKSPAVVAPAPVQHTEPPAPAPAPAPAPEPEPQPEPEQSVQTHRDSERVNPMPEPRTQPVSESAIDANNATDLHSSPVEDPSTPLITPTPAPKSQAKTKRPKSNRQQPNRTKTKSAAKSFAAPTIAAPTIAAPILNVSTVSLTDPEPVPTQTYSEWFRERVSQSKWMTSFFAFYAHWILVIVLAILVVHGPNTRGDFTITASNVTPLEPEPVEFIDTRIVEPETEVAEVSRQTSPTLPIDMSVNSPVLPDSFAADEVSPGSLDAPNEAEPTENQPAHLTPSSAVSRGSFSVWTEPEYPDPGQSYKVIIRAKVPEGVTRYPVTDLQGVVVGSDGYRKMIPGSLRGDLPIRGGYVQFEVSIVAANQAIRDTVWIQSKMLKEQQKLLIEF